MSKKNLTEDNLKVLEQVKKLILPADYAKKIVNKYPDRSVQQVYRVKMGKRYDKEIIDMLIKLAIEHKEEGEKLRLEWEKHMKELGL